MYKYLRNLREEYCTCKMAVETAEKLDVLHLHRKYSSFYGLGTKVSCTM